MKIIGTIIVDNLPESCSNCDFAKACDTSDVWQWMCEISDQPIPSTFRYTRRAWFCKLRAKRKQVRKPVKIICDHPRFAILGCPPDGLKCMGCQYKGSRLKKIRKNYLKGKK